MSDFKVGDTVYFMALRSYDEFGYDEHEPIKELLVDNGVISYFGINNTNAIGLVDKRGVLISDAFKSKQDCVDAFKKRLNELWITIYL